MKVGINLEIINNKLYKYLKNYILEEDNLKINSELKFALSTIISKYLSIGNKEFIPEYAVRENFFYDGYAPNGMGNYKEPIIFEYKLYKDKSIKNLYKRFLNFIEDIEEPHRIIFVVPNIKRKDISLLEAEGFNNYPKPVEIWNLEDLEKKFNYIHEFDFNIVDLLENIDRYYLDYQINKSNITTNIDRLEEHNNKIKDLKKTYDTKNIVLFLGAGVSVDANIPLWDDVISELFMELMDEIVFENDIVLEDIEKSQMDHMLKYETGFSPIIKTRILKTGFRGELEQQLKNVMYKNEKVDETELMKSISNISKKREDGTGIKAIVTYNFDDLLEKSLSARDIKFDSIYSESLLPVGKELGIYHVHGFIPRDTDNYMSLENSNLVFSEEEYHQIMSDPYNWANLSQLEFLTNDTCVFIGLSLTDPNLRRILDISSHKKSVRYNKTYHYAFLKKPVFNTSNENENMEKFKKVNIDLLETFYRESGISIIWFDEFKELPKLLNILLRKEQ